MPATGAPFPHGPKATRLLLLLAQGAALLAGWAIWAPAGQGQLHLALAYVLAVWAVAAVIVFGAYLGSSLAPLPELVADAFQVSAAAMWLVPGALLLASRSPLAVALGVAAVANCTRLLASSRAPKGETIQEKRRTAVNLEPRLFRCQVAQPVYFSRESLPAMFGALALQVGVWALAGQYPLLAAASFAAVTATWVVMSVARGALEAKIAGKAPYGLAGILLALLCTTALTAVLLQTEIVAEGPPPGAPSIETGMPPEPGITSRLLARLSHVQPGPPAPPAPSKAEGASSRVVTQVVDPGPAIGEKGGHGVPGVVLRPRPKRNPASALIVPGAHLHLSPIQSLGFPFTGEYHLFRTSSGALPAGSLVETGTPLENSYGTTNGGPMDTVAIQTFDPPIDLTHCDKVLIVLISAEKSPLLATMQLVTDGGLEDAGTELMGIKPPGEETLDFRVPHARKRLLVHSIRISFQRPLDSKNARVAVQRIMLVAQGS